jgi:hypothetical protein
MGRISKRCHTMNRDDDVTLRKVMSGEWVISKESFMPVTTTRRPLPQEAPTAPPPVAKQEKESSSSR